MVYVQLWANGQLALVAAYTSSSPSRRSVELSPNFALGYYRLGFVQAQARSAFDNSATLGLGDGRASWWHRRAVVSRCHD
jgi:hypothetical protein